MILLGESDVLIVSSVNKRMGSIDMVQMSEDEFWAVYKSLELATSDFDVEDVADLLIAEEEAWEIIRSVAERHGLRSTADPDGQHPSS